MSIFKVAIASMLLFFGVCTANAATSTSSQMPDPQEMAKMQADQMKDVVKLTDAQYPKVLEIFKEQGEKMSKLMEGGMPDQDGMMKIFSEQDEKLKKVLTEEQHKKWTEYIQQMFQNMGGGF